MRALGAWVDLRYAMAVKLCHAAAIRKAYEGHALARPVWMLCARDVHLLDSDCAYEHVHATRTAVES
jgi:hypothetical protein